VLGLGKEHAGLGKEHACAVLDDDTVKCWGGNGFGQLGLGDSNARGDIAAETGTGRPALPL